MTRHTISSDGLWNKKNLFDFADETFSPAAYLFLRFREETWTHQAHQGARKHPEMEKKIQLNENTQVLKW